MQTHNLSTDSGASMRIEFDPSSARMMASLGLPGGDVKEMHFNNIGDGVDPIDFLAESDWNYIKSKIFGSSARTPDFLATITSIAKIASDDEIYDLSENEKIEFRKGLREAMIGFEGDDIAACRSLVPLLQRMGFNDDPAGWFVNRDSDAVVDFRVNVWEPILKDLELYTRHGWPSPFDPDLASENEMEPC